MIRLRWFNAEKLGCVAQNLMRFGVIAGRYSSFLEKIKQVHVYGDCLNTNENLKVMSSLVFDSLDPPQQAAGGGRGETP